MMLLAWWASNRVAVDSPEDEKATAIGESGSDSVAQAMAARRSVMGEE
jgi:hypothetical protein